MATRKPKFPPMEPVGDLLTMLEQAGPVELVVPVVLVVAEIAPVPSEPEPEPEPVAEPITIAVPLAPSATGAWAKVNAAEPPARGTVVRVDGTCLMVWRNLYLMYERRQGEYTALSIPRDYAFLADHPDPGPLAPMHTIALSRIEIEKQQQGDGDGGK